MTSPLSRRLFLAGATAMPALSAFGPAFGQAPARPQPGPYASVISNPPREYGPDARPNSYPDPDIVAHDPAFGALTGGHTSIKRLGTGFEWAEGPAWSSMGQFVVFSDVNRDIAYRYTWETGQISAFRQPSSNSNGNSFDFQGRHMACQHFARRVVRWEHDGSMTVIADNYNGAALNSPNDLAPHPDGSIWFTDPPYGNQVMEGQMDAPGATNPNGLRDGRIGLPANNTFNNRRQTLPHRVYRWDPSGRLDVALEVAGKIPNGIAFSPDYKKVYLSWSGDIAVADVAGRRLENLRILTDCMVDGVKCRSDGHRVDRAGNIWSGANGPVGYCGVTVWNPEGKLLGRIRLPEVSANLCFAGPKRDYLFMCGSQSVYMVRVNIQGASPG